MNIEINPLYEPIFSSNARYFHLWGGRSRGGSHFATDYFLWKMTQPTYFRGAMLRATMAEITQSLWVALQKRITTAINKGDLKQRDIKINQSDHTVTFIPTGNQIICKGFRATSSAAAANLKGLEGITHAIVEEAEDVAQADFMELDATFRTTEVENIQILVLFNPPGKKHWLIKTYYDLIPAKVNGKEVKGWYRAVAKPIPNLLSIHSTFVDNWVNVNDSTKRLYQAIGDSTSHLYNADYYYRSVCGLISEGKKGRIFHKVKSITLREYHQLPYEEFYGLDFGFSNDPAALCGLKYHNGNLYGRKIIYDTHLDNDDLSSLMKKADLDRLSRIYADSAEPKSISMLNKRGFNIIPAIKGPDSIEFGYRELLNITWHIVDDGDKNEFLTEIEEHSWALNAAKEPTDRPEDKNNHIIDAARYAFTMHVSRKGGVRSTRADTIEDEYLSGYSRLTKAQLLESLDNERADFGKAIDDDDIEEFYKDMGYMPSER